MRSAGVSAAHEPHEAARHALRLLHVGSLVDERHVQIAREPELGAAEAPERDHRERDLRVEGAERGLEAGLREQGQIGADLLDGGMAEHVAGGDPEEVTLLPSLQRALTIGHAVPPRDGVQPAGDEVVPRLGAQALGVGQPLDEVGVGDEDVTQLAARAQQEGEVARDLRRVPERDGQRRRALLPRRQATEPEQAEVGIRRGRQPVEQQGQELLHHPRGAGEAPGELVDGLAGALDVREPEGGESLGRGDLAERAHPGQRGQQRPEPHPLVDRADARPVAGQLGVEGLRRTRGRRPPEAEHAGHAAAPVAILGHRVRLPLVIELQHVLHPAEEPVRAGEDGGVVGIDVAPEAELRERGQGPGHAEIGIDAPVHELEQLGGELDVADAPRAALDVALGSAAPPALGFRADLHRAHVTELVGAEGHVPQHGGGGPGPRVTELAIASHRHRLQEGLALPRLRPPLPIGRVGLEAPHERPVPTLRSQVEVDAEGSACVIEQGTTGSLESIGVASPHQREVHVARVVELGPAQLPHPDDGEAVVGREVIRGRRVSPLQDGDGHRREVGRRGVDGGPSSEVAGRDPQQLAPLPDHHPPRWRPPEAALVPRRP